MFRLAFASAFLSLVAGCAVTGVSQVDPEARAAIGYAATARYPGNARPATDRVETAAVAYPNAKELEILNLSQNAINSPTLWVNGSYVRQLATIPPQASLTVKYTGLLQAEQPANDFAHAGQSVTKVELQTPDGLYTVLGPAIKH